MSNKIEESSWNEIKSSKDVEMTVSQKGMKKLLKKAGNDTDSQGFIVDETGERVKANDEREIKMKSLGALAAGSKVFIRDNLASFSDYLARKKR